MAFYVLLAEFMMLAGGAGVDGWMQYGWPTAALLLSWGFFYKAIWPFMKKQITDAQTRADKSHADAIERSDRKDAEFLAALKLRDQEFAKVVKSLDSLADKVDQINVQPQPAVTTAAQPPARRKTKSHVT